MLKCIISSAQRGAAKGPLFEFTPEFYMDAAINAFHGLRHYFHPTSNFSDIPGNLFVSLAVKVVSFVVLISLSAFCSFEVFGSFNTRELKWKEFLLHFRLLA